MLKRLTGLCALVWFMLMSAVSFAKEPVVYSVLFYSPSCPHCQYVLGEHVPLWQKEFGQQLQLVLVDVTTEQGKTLFLAASETPGITFNGFGVPTLIIGTQVIVGSTDIPQKTPDIIRNGLAAGGIELPPIAGLAELVPMSDVASSSEQPITYSTANLLAVVVLLALVLSVGAVLSPELLARQKIQVPHASRLLSKTAGLFALLTSLIATGLAFTLVAETPPNFLLLTGGIFLALIIETIGIIVTWRVPKIKRTLTRWLLPSAAVIGLTISAYLATMETTQTEAFCGLIGDCNTVQQSSYARLFGILPVGVFGIIGYAIVIVLWGLSQINRQHLARLATIGLRTVVLFGVMFSIYLTFLEPFVIGATCIWCLTSSVLMLLLMWLLVSDTQNISWFPQATRSKKGRWAVR